MPQKAEKVQKCVAKGNSYGDIAAKHKMLYRQFHTWVERYREKGEAGLSNR